MRLLSLSAVALSLVIAGCGKEESPTLPKGEAPSSGPNITSTQPELDKPVASTQGETATPPVVKQLPPPSKGTGPVASNDQAKARADAETAKRLKEDFFKKFDATKDQMEIAPSLTTGWLATSLKPDVIAQDLEKRLASSKNISGESRIQLDLQDTKATNFSHLAIQSPSKFYLEYARIAVAPRVDVQKEVIVADGQEYATNAVAKTGWTHGEPLSKFKQEDQASLDQWVTQFPRKIYSALQGGKPISHLLEAARKQGLDVVAEQAFKTNQVGQEVRQYRILISRKPADEEKKGRMMFEIVVDGYRNMPMHVRANIDPPKGAKDAKPTRLWWTARWNLDPNQKLAADSFVIPGQAAQRIATQKL